MASPGGTITPAEWAATLEHAQREMPGLFRRLLLKMALRAQSEAQRSVRSGGGSGLHVRTGRLIQSIRGLVREGGGAGGIEVVVRAGADGAGAVRYARIHELGGVIRPVKGQYLAIPLKTVRTRGGVSQYASPRDQPGLFLCRSAKGQPYLALQGTGKGKRAVLPQWLLRRRVTIPARPYLRPALDKGIARFETELPKAIQKAVLGEGAPAAGGTP